MTTGLLDVATLTPVSSQPGLRLLADVAASWERLAQDVWLHYGWRPTLTDAYRDYDAQVRLFLERYTRTYLPGRPSKTWQGVTYWLPPGQATAATPGTSNHGGGDTVDVRGLGGIGQFDTRAYQQFASLAPEHGWSNREGRAVGEPWHWQRFASQDAHAAPAPAPVAALTPLTPTDPWEDDMIERALIAAYRKGMGRTPSAAELDDRILRVARGQSSLKDEIDLVLGSVEAHRYAVNVIAQELLGRSLSAADADFQWSANEGDLVRIRAGIGGTPEAQAYAAKIAKG